MMRTWMLLVALLLPATLPAQRATYPKECTLTYIKASTTPDSTKARCLADRARVDLYNATTAYTKTDSLNRIALAKYQDAAVKDTAARAVYDSVMQKYKPKPPVPTVATVVIRPPGTSLVAGTTLQLYAEVRDSGGNLMSKPVSWSAAPLVVADLSGTGLLTAKSAGRVVVSATADAVTGQAIYDVTAAQPPPDTTTPSNSIAAQPQNVPKAQYPTCTTSVRVLPGTDLQAALRSATAGTCLLLSQGATFIGNYQLPNRATAGGYVTVTTEGYVSQPGVRMTPSKAAALGLAKILSPNYTEAIGTDKGAHGFIFRGVEIGVTGSASQIASGMNVLVRLTDPTNAAPPSDIQFQQVYVHGDPALDSRRAFRADGAQMVLVDSWGSEIHSKGSDSQLWLGIACAKGHLVENNHLEAGHEIVMFGGGDPPSAACIPQDIVLRRNHITRPASWKGVWQTKNLIETKDVQRYLIEGNVIENVWQDAQAGFAFVMKSENQDGSAPFTTTSDVTIRYNKVNCIPAGFNLSGKGSSSNPNVTSARYDIQHNVFTNFNCIGPTQAIEVQLLSGIQDVQMRFNTFYGLNAGGSGMVLDGGPIPRFIFTNNALHANAYGVKGAGQSAGTATLNAYAPGYVWMNNLLVGTSCNGYPATTVCAGAFPALPTALYGADTATVNRLTAGVVVAP